ncbi:MAG: hypothetical protein UV82_C0013G0015 [Candidatus Magasanikbacteria bacterium GW2011_GWD2_43_18]|nr:MAG: hypothetical protein UV18_C0002G0132 [Candidatus Magasanikbacteria bacterium GW2011_GWC2_42_27]KKT03931.1 MAG: hypothetical protein UV82_C0013G0015 [Candidatus Magasanikbacteria bacterium GW2011_GWD2_43_18]KKT25586.1 MAG: hypothetical protein UW10_C0006G0052 [Candidatus Magasanikbacteria bacterium GW2011_GWA2_43_9]
MSFQGWIERKYGSAKRGRTQKLEVPRSVQTTCPHCHKLMTLVGIKRERGKNALPVVVHIGINDDCSAIVATKRPDHGMWGYFIVIDELRDSAPTT